MLEAKQSAGLETKFTAFSDGVQLDDGQVIKGYASVFGTPDQGGDVVQKGAYSAALKALAARGGRVKMLWQHDPRNPIGVWDEIFEDETGLYVKGRLLADIRQGAEALSLIRAGAIDGLSIGYRTKRAEKNAGGQRLLHELELWEVSIVTFPMLSDARVDSKAEADADALDLVQDLAAVFTKARAMLADDREH